MNADNCEVSVVVPFLNEQETLEALYEQIDDALAKKYSYEIVFVDDGSTDAGVARLLELQRFDGRIRIIQLSRNFGQTAALSAGFKYARGKVIVAIDADLQNDPSDIPKLVAKLLYEGYDVASGWRRQRCDSRLSRLIPSQIANWLIARITGVKLHDFGCTLKAYRREVLEQIRLYGEMHRFIPALANWSGARICEIEVNHNPRTSGTTKYGLERTFKVILDLGTVKFLGSYSTKPIYIFGGLGLAGAFGSMACGLTVLYQKFVSGAHLAMNRNPLLILTVMLVITTVQFILMGLLAEIMVRTYHESQGRPIYSIKEILEPGSER